jgi:hypothetical protein
MKLRRICVLASMLCSGAISGGVVTAEAAQPKSSFKDFALTSRDGQRRLSRLVQESIKNCLSKQGFDYTVWDPTADLDKVTKAGQVDENAYAKLYGYGISTFINVKEPSKVGEQANPNSARMSKMSEAQRKAFLVAVVGAKAAAGSTTPPGPGEGGCQEQATKELFSDTAVLDKFSKRMAEVAKQIESNPKVVPEMAKWRDCFEKAVGKRYETTELVIEFLSQKLSGLLQAAPPAIPGGTAPTFPKETQTAISKLQNEERRLAVADKNCTDKTIKIGLKVQKEVEAKVVEEFRPLLESLDVQLKKK